MICSVPEVKANCDGAEAPKIAARLKFTSKEATIAPPVYVLGSQISLVVPRRKISGGLFTGVVPVQF